MNNVKVRRKNLLERVIKNRDAHRALFLKAQEGYREAAIEQLDEMLKSARENKGIRRSITLIEPQDHTEDYNRVIDMLEMSVEMEITLDARSFDNYVRDHWEWKAFSDATNTAYATKSWKGMMS